MSVMHRSSTLLSRAFILFILVIFGSTTIASAQLTPEEKKNYNKNIFYYDPDAQSCSAVEAAAAAADGKKIIVVDPGHGVEGTETDQETGIVAAETSGASGERKAMWETAQLIQKTLEADGYKVILTKKHEADPAGLLTKSKLASDAKADLVVSLHYTSGKFGKASSQWGATPQEVGRFRENKANNKRKTFTDAAIADKSKAYAKIIAEERTKVGDRTNVVALTGSFPRSRSDIKAWGDISIVQLFATVPWVYNEVGNQGFNKEKYAEGIANGIKKAVQNGSSDPTTTTPTVASTTSDSGLTGATNAEKVYNFFTSAPRNLSGAAAAGIVGNLMQESGGGTENLNTAADNGSHYGIAQWSKADRYKGLRDLARSKGKPVTDLGIQAEYIWQELTTSYGGTLSDMKKAKSAKEAASLFLKGFERSGEGPGDRGYENRLKNAEEIFQKYGEGDATEASAVAQQNNNCACSQTGGTVNPVGSSGTSDGTLVGFVSAYGQAAFNVGKRYSIPYEAILAQAALESGWGKSSLSAEHNNFFGIKADSRWQGETVTMTTQEDNPPRTIQAAFRKYPSAEAGFTGYASFIHHNSRYTEALKFPGDPVRYITELRKAGYATDNSYVPKNVKIQQDMIKYIREKNLFPPSSQVQHENQIPPDQNSASSETASYGGSLCNTGSVANDSVVKVALAEHEKHQEKSLGTCGNNCGPEIKTYTEGRTEAWCADFVSWVYKQAGKPFTDGPAGTDPAGWRHPGVKELKDWFTAKHVYFKVGEQKPQPGDVAFYIGPRTADRNSTEHVNIVVEVNGERMTVVGGNQGNDQVSKRTQQIKLGENSLVGFGRLKN